ncbi:DHA2 family efflux MFS transporter permease subunit [Acaricomes phytoseiuli]|uniref:DHA2 family efflux MFS transporter permease subunit n=1 Tax=Acaricomes phytoseiuli TaxID=291968 RepID=UPI000369514D|nr:DHA2 family efflux MFS transporter permease subunit [Acaricomes phytoseiuli]MCW1249146.1 DHA2 family efflux MFS transporter permease subunit [Acaricomes phytoseiuli]
MTENRQASLENTQSSSGPQGPEAGTDTATSTETQRPTAVLGLLLAATFVVFLNETIMSVALVPLKNDLQVSESTVQWLSTAFMLTMATVSPMTGYLLQRLTTRQVFILAMSLFSAGTLLALIAPGFGLLLVGRIVQATGTAIMMPLLMTTIMQLVPAESRGKTMGNVSIVISVAPAVGPTLAGIILSVGSWRGMFGLMLPIALIMLLIGIKYVRNVNEPKPAPLDLVSVALAAVGFSSLVYGLSQMAHPVGGGGTLALFIGIGVITLIAFVWRQIVLQRKDKALLDLRTFRSRTFTAAVLLMVLAMMALFGTIILLPFYLQGSLGMESLWVGLLLLPGGLVMGLAAPWVGRQYDKHGPRPLLVPGTVVVSVALWLFSTINAETSPYLVMSMHILLSAGLALIFTPLFSAGMGSLEPKLYSYGSATLGTVQQVAGAAGTALFVAIMSSQSSAAALTGSSAEAATAEGVRSAFMVGAILFTLTIAIAWFIRKPEPVAGH